MTIPINKLLYFLLYTQWNIRVIPRVIFFNDLMILKYFKFYFYFVRTFNKLNLIINELNSVKCKSFTIHNENKNKLLLTHRYNIINYIL